MSFSREILAKVRNAASQAAGYAPGRAEEVLEAELRARGLSIEAVRPYAIAALRKEQAEVEAPYNYVGPNSRTGRIWSY